MSGKIKNTPKGILSATDAERLVRECDKEFDLLLRAQIDCLCQSDAKVILLSGPTCSGKSTVAKKIVSELEKRGKAVHIISVDDFYYDREKLNELSLQSGNGEIDYDSVKTIDITELERFADKLDVTGELKCPIFDFKSGGRIGYRNVRVDAEDVFIFEGIQVIYPEIKALFARYRCANVHIEPTCELWVGDEWFDKNEIRFLRRLVRDRHFRNTSPEFTFKIWKSVRDNEDKNIFPYVHECDYYIESGFAYEIGVLKPYLVEYLSEIGEDSEYRKRADKILARIAPATEISSAYISEESLYKEFV